MKICINTLRKLEEEFGQFDICRVVGNDKNYLRFGYWKRVNFDRLQEILQPSIKVEEDSYYDNDCGWQYSYTIYDHVEWENIIHMRESQWCNYSGMPSPDAYTEKNNDLHKTNTFKLIERS